MAMSILFAGKFVDTKGTTARFYYRHMDSICSIYSIYPIHSIYSIYCALIRQRKHNRGVKHENRSLLQIQSYSAVFA